MYSVPRPTTLRAGATRAGAVASGPRRRERGASSCSLRGRGAKAGVALLCLTGLVATYKATRRGVSATATFDPETMPGTLWEYSAKDIDGNELSLSEFKGDVALVVNTATY